MRDLLGCVLIILLLVCADSARAQESEPTTVPPSAMDRELVARFTRAYGMAREALTQHAGEVPSAEDRDARLRHPDELDGELRTEIYSILELNGLDLEDWQAMFQRMEKDEELRQRVESLSASFQQQ